jgi:hypothetical protein
MILLNVLDILVLVGRRRGRGKKIEREGEEDSSVNVLEL